MSNAIENSSGKSGMLGKLSLVDSGEKKRYLLSLASLFERARKLYKNKYDIVYCGHVIQIIHDVK